jgi:hypothetical protein
MRTRVFPLLFVTVLGGCVSGTSEEDKAATVKTLIRDLGNRDIEWDGDFVGLSPRVKGRPSLELANRDDERTVQDLILSLKKRERFVAAHVLLTQITGIDYQRDESMWNGLHVDLRPSGEALYVVEDMDYLYQCWEKWFSRGRPKSGLDLIAGTQLRGQDTKYK